MASLEPLWTWPDLCQGLGLIPVPGPNISGIQFDSRLAQPGDLFLPLPGDPGPRFNVAVRSDRDGHDYISEAVTRGAAGLVLSRDVAVGLPSLKVNNTIDALWSLAEFRRQQLNCQVIAITGSSGKTTLKAFLQSVTQGFSAQGSFNNYIGLPLSIASTPLNTETAIYEIGTNHPGEIAPMSTLAQPTVSIVLNVLPVHIGNFGSLDELEHEKCSIVTGLNDRGYVVLPYALKNSKHISRSTSKITFGFELGADVTIKHQHDNFYEFRCRNNMVSIDVPGGGNHRAETVAACGAVLVALGHDIERLSQLEVSLPPGRGNCLVVNQITIIDDSYNANPTSMIAALQELRKRSATGRKFALLGQMNELGDQAQSLHESIAAEVGDVDVLYCVGRLMRHLHEKVHPNQETYYFEHVNNELLRHLVTRLRKHDIVLVKGSNSIFWQAKFAATLHQELA